MVSVNKKGRPQTAFFIWFWFIVDHLPGYGKPLVDDAIYIGAAQVILSLR